MRVFAGPNGSGKSFLYNVLHDSGKFNSTYFLNADNIERQLGEKGFINLSELNLRADIQSYLEFSESSSLIVKARNEGYNVDIQFVDNFLVNKSKNTNSYEAAFLASYLRKEFIKVGRSFAFETVMSHSSKLNDIKEANSAGFQTYLYYIATESPIINIDRIESRVAKGGHWVADDKVISRFHDSLSLLYDAIQLVKRAYIFDNSGREYKLIAEFNNGIMKDSHHKLPSWFHKYVIQKISF